MEPMRIKHALAASFIGLFTGGLAAAEPPPAELPTIAPSAPAVPLPVVTEPVPIAAPSLPLVNRPESSRLWGNAEYLLWWSKASPVPVPIATLGSITPNLAPVLGVPGNSVVLGGHDLDLGTRSGGRFSLGGWLNERHTIGIDAGYLFLGSSGATQTVASSGSADSPFLAIPFIDRVTGNEASTRLALPGSFAGFGALSATNSFQGGELNGLWNIIRRDDRSLSVIVGFRYLNLQDQLTFTTNSPSVVGPADVFTTFDRFATFNDFYGGQIGARWERQFGKLSWNATVKVAFGSTQQTIATTGQLVTNDFNNFGPVQTFPGGYFTQPTNIGRQTDDAFSVLTDIGLNLGYQVTQRLRVYAGYSLLTISNVVQPGDQIDRRINPSQAPAITGVVPPALVGPAAPLPQFNTSTFWAHGVNFGVQLQY
jgi:hypothetical protein